MAQNNDDYIWAKSFNPGYVDRTKDEDSDSSDPRGTYDISVDSEGNVYMAGEFLGEKDFDPGEGTFLLTSNGENDSFVSKLDHNGIFKWAKKFGGDGNSGGNLDATPSISVDSEGNVYTTGGFGGTADLDPSEAGIEERLSKGLNDIYVSKLDKDGNLNWVQNWGSTGYDRGLGVTVDSEGNVYITGSFQSKVDFGSNADKRPFNSNGGDDVYVAKLDKDGKLLWAESFGGKGSDKGENIGVDSEGNVYISGFFNGKVDFDPGDAEIERTSYDDRSDIFISKFNKEGKFEWVESFGGGFNDVTNGISIDTEGNVYISGSLSFGNDFIAKLDKNGNLDWEKSFELTYAYGYLYIGGINLDSTGNIYTTGTFYGGTDFDPDEGKEFVLDGNEDGFISKLDPNGNFIWAKQFPGGGHEFGLDVSVDSTGNVYTLGEFWGVVDVDPSEGTVELNNGKIEIFVSKWGVLFEPLPINPKLTGVSLSDAIGGDYDNDGDLDALISGLDVPTTIYKNNGGNFTTEVTLPEVSNGAVAWGDYDNDGDLDIALTGSDEFNIGTAQIHRNDNGAFTNIAAGLPNFYGSDLAWGDYDNDGDLDLVINGIDDNTDLPTTKVYRNDQGTFVDSEVILLGLANGSVAWGDYDKDQDLDILVTGQNQDIPYTIIYSNEKGNFTEINAGLPGVKQGDAAWGDYNNDGTLDLVLTGIDKANNPLTKVYKNLDKTFSEAVSEAENPKALAPVADSSVAWGDYDNDGDLDILLTGSNQAFVYRNENDTTALDTFANIEVELNGVSEGSGNWGDYDGDSILDILLTGNNSTEIFKSNAPTPNTPPNPPTNLNAVVTGNTVKFSWDAATDAETIESEGLNYNLKIGTTPGGADVFSSMSLDSGFRQVPQMGNTNHNISWTLDLPYQGIPYYWTVQTIDTAFAGSAFATPLLLLTPGVNLTQTDGNTTVIENGITDTYSVVLNSIPTQPVTITLTPSDPNINLGLGAGIPITLTFAPDATALTPQTVTVTAINDSIFEGNQISLITPSASSLDPYYNGVTVPFTVDGIPNSTITVNIIDNDNFGINITPLNNLTTTETGGTATFDVVLTSQPINDVSFNLNSSNLNEGILSTSSLIFTPLNWNLPQTVTITGVDDNLIDGDITYSIITSPIISSDVNYNNLDPNDITVINTDNEIIPTYNFSLANYSTTEGNLSNIPNLVEIIRTGSNIAEEITVIATGGSATLGTDYSLGSWIVNFAEGQTQAFVPIEILGDSLIESDETINLEIAALSSIGIPGTQNTATLTIQNDDTPSTINFSQPIYQVNETGTVVNEIILNRTGNLSQSSTVEVLLASGTATAGTDFINTPILVNFAENQASASITIPILSDSILEPTETIFLTLENPDQTTTLGTQNSATVEILDNNLLGVEINPTQVSVTERGDTDSYTLRLSSQPSSPVTINFNSDNQIEPISAVIFDSNNWNIPQTARVKAVDDNQIEGSHTTQINATVSSNNSNFFELTLPAITVNITDNDTAGISINPSLLSVTEAGTTATFTVVLTTQPTQPVTVNFNTDNQLQPLTAITFNEINWNQPKTVTVIAENDNLKEGFHQAKIFSTVSSQDPNYNQLQTNPVQVEITDNDTEGVSISRNNLNVREGETTDTYNIVLTSQPTDPVTISFNTDNQLQIIPAITFDSTNWNQPQQITVAAIDDNQLTGNRTSTITHLANSADLNYNELTISSVAVEITDNDAFPEILINPISLISTEGGSNGNYNIVLTQKPTSPVTINFATGDQLNPISAITFDQNNWNQPQEIIVIPVNDAIAESQTSNIIRHSITTTDQQYATLTPANVTAIIQDNDTASVIITETENSTEVSEDNVTDTYTLKLSSKPTSNVTITVTPDSQTNLGNGANNAIQLTFTPENWEIPQTVTVAAIDDEDIEDATHTSTLIHTVSSNDSSYNSQNFSLTVNITENDEPLPPGIAGIQIIQPVRNSHVWEGFGFDPYKIVLTSQPTDDVKITLSYPNQIDCDQTILTFTPDNWNLPQTITLTAIDDELLETDQLPTITHQANSSDSRYQGLTATISPNNYDNDNLGEIRDLTLGDALGLTANDDKIQGSIDNDILYGQDGNDHLIGNNGNDFILGQGGNDGLFGEQGNDLILGGNGIDFLSGGQGDDILFGGAGDDRLMGEEGNDQLFGDFGNDRLVGGKGTDSLTGFSGNDAFVISAEQGSFSLTGSDVITDFKLTEDKIELLGNLTFDQLKLTSGTEAFSQHTIIQLKSTGEYLAIVLNLTPERLESGNFI